jgi:serine/threonine protein kinase
MAVTLTYSQGHTWELPDDSPNGSTVPCPVCAEMVTLPPIERTLSLPARTPQGAVAPTASIQPRARSTNDHFAAPPDSSLRAPAALLAPEVPGFELLDEIGRGGMGVVWRVRDLSLDRAVAIKILHEKYSADSTVADRFVEEARITGQLQHPGIPAVYQVGKLADGRPYLAIKQTIDY